MNKIPCEVIKDLLPSYIDSLTSDKTRELVDEHLKDCKDCSNALKKMRGESDAQMQPDEDDKKEIAFLKKTKRMQNIAFLSSIAAIVLCALFVLLRFFIVGISYSGSYYVIDKLSMENGVVSIKAGIAGSSANVISRMKFEETDGWLKLTPNEVPVSIFCPGEKEFSYTLKHADQLRTICIGDQIIWEAGSPMKPFSAVTSAVYLTRHAYIGDMSANQRTANALNIYSRLGEYENRLETAKEPYGWIIQLKEDVPASSEALLNSDMQSVAYILIAVIDNLDHVSFEYTSGGENRSLSFDAAEATSFLGRDIKDCSGSIGLLDELIEKTGF
ncbi:MAG: DUF4825 domain-containing protein [Lachnospiraceae bacterium]|nr:DUF4825 domain-containing protein [Lachnospiraceae bacterium]